MVDLEDQGCFRCVKITLIVIHVIGVLICSIFFILCLVALFAADSQKIEEDKEKMKMAGTFCTILFAFAFVYELIALIGIARENKTIVLAYLVLSIIGVFGNMFYGMGTGLLSLVVVGLTGLYGYMIVKRDRQTV